MPGVRACGRTNTRIRGWLGRADQTAKVRAVFVTPKLVDLIVRRHSEITRARLVIDLDAGNDRMTLRCESAGEDPGLREALARSIREVTQLRGEVELVAPGSLPHDGLVIQDASTYDERNTVPPTTLKVWP